jgi:hypothetical protein
MRSSFSHRPASPWLSTGFLLGMFALCCFFNPLEGRTGQVTGINFLRPFHFTSAATRLGVFQTDSWSRSLEDGSLNEVAHFPVEPSWFRHLLSLRPGRRRFLSLMHGAPFTPADYLEQIQTLTHIYPGGCDVLFYYGAIHPSGPPQGLNFNSWTVEDLRQLRARGGRPFIGLESGDLPTIDAMVQKLAESGYRSEDHLFVRILSEPSTMAYGSVDGTSTGTRYTKAAYQAYQHRFLLAANEIRSQGRRHHLRLRIVFVGDCARDFMAYAPPAENLDALGVDLYVTPANYQDKLVLLDMLAHRWPNKPLVIPELGIATSGMALEPGHAPILATPAWATAIFGEVLKRLGQHPAGTAQITVFSVDVAARLFAHRWSWAWTPEMYDMLSEWNDSPKTWRADGFHRHDLLSYPEDQDILYGRTDQVKVYYRRLRNRFWAGRPVFRETIFRRDPTHWKVFQREVVDANGQLIEALEGHSGAVFTDRSYDEFTS